jgi:hypothetical protein
LLGKEFHGEVELARIDYYGVSRAVRGFDTEQMRKNDVRLMQEALRAEDRRLADARRGFAKAQKLIRRRPRGAERTFVCDYRK